MPSFDPDATLQVLGNRDLVDQIIEQYNNSNPFKRMTFPAQKSFARLSLTSKTFLEPVLNVVWSEMGMLKSLFATIDDTLVLDEPFHPADASRSTKAFDRFNFYARKIRSLQYDRPVTVHPILAARMRQLYPDGILPRLRTLTLQLSLLSQSDRLRPTTTNCLILPLVFSEAVTQLRVLSDYGSGSAQRAQIIPILTTQILTPVATRLGNLESVSLPYGVPLECLQLLALACPTLKKLRARGVISWPTLARFTSLQDLDWESDSKQQSPLDFDPVLLPNLLKFQWLYLTPLEFLRFSQAVSTPSLVNLTLNLHYKFHFSLFRSATLSTPHLDEITIGATKRGNKSLRDVLCFIGLQSSPLRHIRIFGIIWDLEPPELLTAVRTLAKFDLRSLCIPRGLHEGPSAGDHVPTFQILQDIATLFPHLSYLQLTIDGQALTSQDLAQAAASLEAGRSAMESRHPLESLLFGLGREIQFEPQESQGPLDRGQLVKGAGELDPQVVAARAERAQQLALYIDSVFPSLGDSVRVADCAYHPFWNDVFERLRMVQRGRRAFPSQ